MAATVDWRMHAYVEARVASVCRTNIAAGTLVVGGATTDDRIGHASATIRIADIGGTGITIVLADHRSSRPTEPVQALACAGAGVIVSTDRAVRDGDTGAVGAGLTVIAASAPANWSASRTDATSILAQVAIAAG